MAGKIDYVSKKEFALYNTLPTVSSLDRYSYRFYVYTDKIHALILMPLIFAII